MTVQAVSTGIFRIQEDKDMYTASDKRYEKMLYNRCGASGLKLPAVSLGLWHNFGDTGNFENMRQICFTAFDNGITHLTLPTTMVRNPGARRRILAGS